MKSLPTLVVFFTTCWPAISMCVLGGEPANSSRFGNKVYIFDTRVKQSSIVCSGAAISPRHLITAAHCFDHVLKKNCKKNTDNSCSIDFLLQGQSKKGFRIHRHPNYLSQKAIGEKYLKKSNFDVAIVSFKKPQFNDFFNLPQLNDANLEQALFLGYGMSQLSLINTPSGNSYLENNRGQLKKVNFENLRNQGGLIVSSKTSFTLNGNMAIQQYGGGGQILRSDSGGPLIQGNKIVAVARNYTISQELESSTFETLKKESSNLPKGKTHINCFLLYFNSRLESFNFYRQSNERALKLAHEFKTLTIKLR